MQTATHLINFYCTAHFKILSNQSFFLLAIALAKITSRFPRFFLIANQDLLKMHF